MCGRCQEVGRSGIRRCVHEIRASLFILLGGKKWEVWWTNSEPKAMEKVLSNQMRKCMAEEWEMPCGRCLADDGVWTTIRTAETIRSVAVENVGRKSGRCRMEYSL